MRGGAHGSCSSVQLLTNEIGEFSCAHAIRAEDIGGVVTLAERSSDARVDAVGDC